MTQTMPEVGPLPAFVTSIEIVGSLTPTDLVRSLIKDPKAAAHVYALLGAVLHNEGILPREKPAPVSISLGEALRNHMHKTGQSRQGLASRMGISYPYLCELINDQKTPGPSALKGLTAAGVDVSRVTYL